MIQITREEDTMQKCSDDQRSALGFFREGGRNADRRANEIEIAEANAAGIRRRAELDQSRTVRPRV